MPSSCGKSVERFPIRSARFSQSQLSSNFSCSPYGRRLSSVEVNLSMRTLFALTLFFAGLLLLASQSPAQSTATSEPVGFTTTTCLSNSDTFVSLPFTRAPEFVGGISSAAGNIITVSGSPNWTTSPKQFVYVAGTQANHYYALIGGGGASNPKEGHYYPITDNGTNTLTVTTTAADDLTGIVANTQVLVIPYWTPATVFPATDANVSFTATTSTATYKTQILIPDRTAGGINLPFLPAYFFSNNVDGTSSNVGWRVVGNNTTNRGDDILPPDSYFVIRNANGAPTLPLTSIGSVLTKKFAIGLVTSAMQARDNAVSMIRPVDVALNASGLNPTDGSFVASELSPRARNNGGVALKDQLLLFDNAQAVIGKSPSAVYYYLNAVGKAAGWKLSGDGLTNHDNDLIPAGSAIVIRKAKTSTAQTVFWTNAPTY